MKRKRTEHGVCVYTHDECTLHETRSDEGIEHQEVRAPALPTVAVSTARPTRATVSRPEQAPARLAAVRERLDRLHGVVFNSDFAPATDEALRRVHSHAYLRALADVERDFEKRPRAPEPLSPQIVTRLFPSSQIHGMTMVSQGSMRAARRAAGAVIAAIDDVLAPSSANRSHGHAFCLVRPPGE